jgi:hypothetical protein
MWNIKKVYFLVVSPRQVPLPKLNFKAPDGWKFDGEWFKNPELR